MQSAWSIIRVAAVVLCLLGGTSSAAPDPRGDPLPVSLRWHAYLQLGLRAYADRRYDESGRYFELALKETTGFGQRDPRRTRTLVLLAETYKAQRRYADAERIFGEALIIDEMLFAADHPQVIRDLRGIADLYYRRGDYAKSEGYFDRLVEASESRYGANHPMTAMALNDLAVVYVVQQRFAEAEPLLRRTVDIFESGRDGALLAMARENYARLLEQLHRHRDAGAVRRRLRESLRGR